MSQNIVHLTPEGLAYFQESFDSLAESGSHPTSDDETDLTTAAVPTSASHVSLHPNLELAPPAFASRFPSALREPTLPTVRDPADKPRG